MHHNIFIVKIQPYETKIKKFFVKYSYKSIHLGVSSYVRQKKQMIHQTNSLVNFKYCAIIKHFQQTFHKNSMYISI